jgi:hypothetical protein
MFLIHRIIKVEQAYKALFQGHLTDNTVQAI